MQLVGYSNFAQKTLESNAILFVKIFGGKHRSRGMYKAGEYVLPCCCKVSRDTSKNFAALQLLDLPKHNNNGRNTINNKNTTVQCTLMMTCHF